MLGLIANESSSHHINTGDITHGRLQPMAQELMSKINTDTIHRITYYRFYVKNQSNTGGQSYRNVYDRSQAATTAISAL